MRRRYLIPALFLGAASSLLAQCSPSITSNSYAKVRHLPTPSGVHLPPSAFIEYSYPLEEQDRLLIYSEPIDIKDIGALVHGIIVLQHDKPARVIPMKQFAILHTPMDSKDDFDYADNYFSLGFAVACDGDKSVYFASFHYMGDMTSPELILTISKQDAGYKVSTFPLLSAGVLEISRSSPLKLRTWSNLGEGSCNACDTPYEISTFALKDSRPVRTSHYRTKRLYTSGDKLFNNPAMRLVP